MRKQEIKREKKSKEEIYENIIIFVKKYFKNLLTSELFFGIISLVNENSNFYGGIPKCLLTWQKQKPLNVNGM